jgi:hypothetical protein
VNTVKSQQSSQQDRIQIGVDFGMNTTVIAVSDPVCGCHTLKFPGISREYLQKENENPVHAIPCLIQYEHGRAIRIGDEVSLAGACDLPTTARWMRQHLCDRSPVQIAAGKDRLVRYDEASEEFLNLILTQTLEEYPHAGLVFALPDCAPAEFSDLLNRIARAAGASSCAWVHEYWSVASGNGYLPVIGEPFLIITCSDTGIEIAATVPEDVPGNTSEQGMRILARVTGTPGCRAIDTRIRQDLLKKFRLLECDQRAAYLAPKILYEAARARELIPRNGEYAIQIKDINSEKPLLAMYTTADLNRVLDDSGIIMTLQDSIDRTFSTLRMRGVDQNKIRNVFLVGTGCCLPAVKDAIRSRFPQAIVFSDHPVDAAARGAATSASQGTIRDRIVCSYALRYWDPVTREHHYRFLVHSGARYPSMGQIARIIISAAYDGQTHLGLPLYEIGEPAGNPGPGIELIAEGNGGVRLAGPVQKTGTQGTATPVNAHNPTLLVATPAARKGEPRFECTFTIDPERNLCISARDLVTGVLVKTNVVVHHLT